MSTRLGLLTLLARDMAGCKAFYTELLGYAVVQEFSSPAGDFLLLHSQSSNVNIALQDAAKQTYGIPLDHGGLILGFLVDDADAVYRDWQSKSVHILGDVIDMGAGRMFTAKDPDGNAIQVYHLHPPVVDMQKRMGLL